MASDFRKAAAIAKRDGDAAFAGLFLDAAERCETLELKLAACTAAALGNTDRTVAERIEPGHPYYSASYGDVCRAVDREMKLREQLATAKREAVEAFYAAVMKRADRIRATGASVHGVSEYSYSVTIALDAELARIREDR